jgi:hypothetical protein
MMAPAQREMVKQNASKLKLGDKREAVLALLGDPTYDQILADKRTGAIKGRSYEYYFEKVDSRFVSTTDKRLELFFDSDDALKNVCSNISGISSADCPSKM